MTSGRLSSFTFKSDNWAARWSISSFSFKIAVDVKFHQKYKMKKEMVELKSLIEQFKIVESETGTRQEINKIEQNDVIFGYENSSDGYEFMNE